MTNPFGVDSHDVSKARVPGARAAAYGAQRTPAQLRRIMRGRTKPTRPQVVVVPASGAAPKVSPNTHAKNAAVSAVAGAVASNVVRYGTPAVLGAAGGVAATRRERRKKPLAKAAPMAGGKPVTEERLRRRKQIQGGLGMTAAGLSTAAFGSKTGGMLLPKMMKAPARAASYKRHLDRAATVALFGASGVGGASGLHQSRVYQLEGKLKRPEPKVAKAYDPEKRRMKRLKAYEGTAAAGAVGLGAAAARPNKKIVIQGSEAARRVRERARTNANEGRKLLEGPHPKPKQGRELLDTAARQARSAKKIVAIHGTKIPAKQRAILGGAAVASAGTAAGLHRYRDRGGKPYRHWFDGKVRKRIDLEPEWVAKGMPDQADLHVAGGGRRKKRRVLKQNGVTVSYC